MKIPVSALRAGFIFSKPVYISDNNLLVPAGVEIREKDIEHLRSWDIETVETEGAIIGESSEDASESDKAAGEPGAGTGQSAGEGPPAQAAARPEKAALMGKVIPEEQKIDIIFQNYQDFIKKIDDFFVQITSGSVPDIRAVTVITNGLLQGIRDSRITAIGYILGSDIQSHKLAKNSINTAILSALIAGDFKFSDQNIRQLIAGALLHDTGMLKLPQ
ncbi:MAG: hypothetical protein LBH57_00320 [Treponema sp.]|nr:hypothetical protein [Treponema sp.]